MDRSESDGDVVIGEVTSMEIEEGTYEISRQGRNIVIFHRENLTQIRMKGTYKQGNIEIDDPETAGRRVRVMDRLSDVFDIDIADLLSVEIPLVVAAESKPILACYLYSFKGWKVPQIARLLDLRPQTVEQYLTDVLNDRR